MNNKFNAHLTWVSVKNLVELFYCQGWDNSKEFQDEEIKDIHRSWMRKKNKKINFLFVYFIVRVSVDVNELLNAYSK